MAKQNIDEPVAIVQQMVKDDRGRDELYRKIDEAVACHFEPSKEVQQLPWVKNRHYGMTSVADARNTGARTFSTLLPQIEISPNFDTDDEYQRTEMAEQVWEWEFERMNRVQSRKGFHDRLVEQAITYHAIAFQTEYLPYKFKGMKSDKRIKALLAHKNFNWSIHHPGTVHSQTDDYDQLQRVAKVVTMTAQELADNFRGNPAVNILKSKFDNGKESEMMNAKWTLVDFMDWDKRIKWAYEGTGDVVTSDVIFMNEAHGLDFIPWVVVNYGDPLWQSIIQSGLWENIQYVNMLMYAKAIEQSTRSTIVIKTPDGSLQNIWIDFENPSNPIVAPVGSEITDLRPAPIDPQMSLIFQRMFDEVSSSTVSSVLTNIGQYAQAPFSTVERIVQLALGQLSPAKKTAEAGEAEGIYQGFQWIKHSDIPMVGYRRKTSDSQTQGAEARGRGEQIVITPAPFPTQDELAQMTPEAQTALARMVHYDLEYLYISVHLQAENVADEQSRLNLMINATDRMNMSKQDAWEKMGWKNFELSQQHRLDEIMLDAVLQNEITRMDFNTREQMRNEIMQQVQQEMAAQQAQQEKSLQNQQNEMNAGTQFTSLQGRDMRAGGQPAAQVAPLATREQVTGQTAAGVNTQ